MSGLEQKAKELEKMIQLYRDAELENNNRLRNPWFRAYRDTLLFAIGLLEEAQKDTRELDEAWFIKYNVLKEKAQKLEVIIKGTTQQADDIINELKTELKQVKKVRDVLGRHHNKLVDERNKALKQVEEANNLKVAISKILDESDVEIILPILGHPAVFRSETEYETGYAAGFYEMRGDSIQIINALKKRLCEVLKENEK